MKDYDPSTTDDQTKAQQRALAGSPRRTPTEQFLRLVRGPDKDNPKPLLAGIARLYRGCVRVSTRDVF
jgi:hypothetical protein